MNSSLGIVWLRLASELRNRWRALLVLALFVGIGGAVSLTALAGARRADTAMTRFLSFTRSDDGGFIYGSPSSLPPVSGRAAYSLAPFGVAKQALELPQVESWFRAPYLFVTTRRAGTGGETLNANGAGNSKLFHSVDRPFVVAGRLSDPAQPFEATINELAADKEHLHVGSHVRLYMYSYPQIQNGNLTGLSTFENTPPAGPSFSMKITGIVRFPTDVSAILPIAEKQDVNYEGQANIYLTPAFLERAASGLGIPVERLPDMQFFGVRLHHGTADWKAFSSAATALGHGQIFTSAGNTEGFDAAASSAERGIHLEVVALVVFGALALLVTILLIGQAVARQVVLDADDHATLRSLGVTRRQLLAMVLLRALAIGLIGGAIAVLGAYLFSPLLPVGLARQAEIQPGFAFNAAILIPGFFAILALIGARSVIPALRASRRSALARDEDSLRSRPSWVEDAMARSAVPPPTAIGVRYGIEPGYGRSAVPVVSALIGAIVAVAALAASLTFAASLDHLIATPRQQGWNWDVLVGNPNDLTDREVQGGKLLAHDRFVGGYSAIAILAGASQGTAVIDGKVVDALLAFDPMKSYVYPPVLQGHAPRADDEIVLATKTMKQLHKRIGQFVVIQGGQGNFRLRIVGTMISPSIGDLFTNGVGDGGWVYGPAVRQSVEQQEQAAAQSQGQGQSQSTPPTVFNLFAVRYAPGTSRAEALTSLRRQFGDTVLQRLPAEDVVNLQSVDGLPTVLAALVVLLGAMTVGNTLVSSVRRRRRDLAILKTVGFVRRQVAAVVAWQATSYALLALIVGLPAGVAVGRWVWDLVASNIGSASPPVVPAIAVCVIVPATLLVANLIAGWPGWAAARVKPAQVMRTE